MKKKNETIPLSFSRSVPETLIGNGKLYFNIFSIHMLIPGWLTNNKTKYNLPNKKIKLGE